MDYLLNEQQVMIRDLCRQIAQEKIAPVAAEYDKSEEFPWPIVKLLAQADIFGVSIPAEYGEAGCWKRASRPKNCPRRAAASRSASRRLILDWTRSSCSVTKNKKRNTCLIWPPEKNWLLLP
jgi:hypothetical protein